MVGGLIGVVAFGGRPASLEEAALRTRAALSESAGLLEIASIEYVEAVSSSGTVLSDPEYQGSLGALDRARARYAGVAAAVGAFDPAQAADIHALLSSLDELMRRPAPPPDVQDAIDQLSVVLRGTGR